MNIYEMLMIYLKSFLYATKRALTNNLESLSRAFDGIAIGIYANLVGDAVKGNLEKELLFLLLIGIICTVTGTILKKKDS